MTDDKPSPLDREPSKAARATAFQILTNHPDCLRDDTVLNGLIDDIAAAVDAGIKQPSTRNNDAGRNLAGLHAIMSGERMDIIERLQNAIHRESALFAPATTEVIETMRAAIDDIRQLRLLVDIVREDAVARSREIEKRDELIKEQGAVIADWELMERWSIP
jgi:hypothetical protein